jgi:hypothetical protein
MVARMAHSACLGDEMSLGFALDQPAHPVLYQPFWVLQIGRVAAVAEEIAQPLAVGAAWVWYDRR